MTCDVCHGPSKHAYRRSRRVCVDILVPDPNDAGRLARCCSDWCALAFTQGKIVMDMSEQESEAIEAAGEAAGKFLDGLGKTDLATMDVAQWMTFITTVCWAYAAELGLSPEAPRVTLASDDDPHKAPF